MGIVRQTLGKKEGNRMIKEAVTVSEEAVVVPRGIYANGIKRVVDFTLALLAVIVLFPILLLLTIMGAVAMKGNPFFAQPRPGRIDKNGRETIFKLLKFRTMTDETDGDGYLLSDEQRLNAYGRFLRSTSLDELPELWNILRGDMAVVGPRPQLVRDMTFMTERQRKRHIVRPGLTGLAQINGRNNITWLQKFEYDLQYINDGISFWKDMRIIFGTVFKVLDRSDIVREGTSSDMDFGDWLMAEGKVDQETYDACQAEAKELIGV